jgi:hypothetical protein
MKKASLFITLLFLVILTACKKSVGFLDNQASTSLSEQEVFSDSVLTMEFLGRIYEDIGFSFYKTRFQTGNTEVDTDDGVSTGSNAQDMGIVLAIGTVGPLNFPDQDFWDIPYEDIRRVNLFLSELAKTPLTPSTRLRVAGEARFLRAWFYQKLICTFGGVPLIGDTVFQATDFINIPRSPYAQCVNYITSELDSAAKLLPTATQYSQLDYGRATSGACLALKSRVLLFAASPLFNGGSITTDPGLAQIISYPTYNVSNWQKAADAADTLINLGEYQLVTDNTTEPGYGFYNLFLQRVNSEYILGDYRAPTKDFEAVYNPISRGGSKLIMPTENAAEAFPMQNGKPITDPTSGYDPNNPYVNRDPRFRYSFIFNGSSYYSTTVAGATPVYTYKGAPSDGFPVTATGYYSRKMCDSTVSANSSFTTDRAWPLMRYAEILLNYAEAINETGQTQLAYPKLEQLRARAGIDPGPDGLYGITANMTVDQMRSFIQNERRIELFFDDQRWDDIRRWEIGVSVNNSYNNAMEITKTGSAYTYNVVSVAVAGAFPLHVMTAKNYLLPIPETEITKMPAMVQNPEY